MRLGSAPHDAAVFSDDRLPPDRRISVELLRRIRDFRLIVEEEGVIVRGAARSYYDKQLIQHAVMRAFSVPILANEVEVV